MQDREEGLEQVLYTSHVSPSGSHVDPGPILEQSRHNNAIDGVSGLLYSGDGRYLQVLEGPAASVEETFARIRRDLRHQAISVIRERMIAVREFGYWSMAAREPHDPTDEFDVRMERMLMTASDDVRRAFVDLVTGRAA